MSYYLGSNIHQYLVLEYRRALDLYTFPQNGTHSVDSTRRYRVWVARSSSKKQTSTLDKIPFPMVDLHGTSKGKPLRSRQNLFSWRSVHTYQRPHISSVGNHIGVTKSNYSTCNLSRTLRPPVEREDVLITGFGKLSSETSSPARRNPATGRA